VVENAIIKLAGRRCPTGPIRIGEVLPSARVPATREYLEKTPDSSVVWNGSICRQIGVCVTCVLLSLQGGRASAQSLPLCHSLYIEPDGIPDRRKTTCA
jgi:hypothetical protein